MYCRSCGQQLDDRAVACTRCGVHPLNGTGYCQTCGKPVLAGAAVCPACGVPLASAVPTGLRGADKKIPAGICGILLGSLGVHKFILGYTTAGLIMLLITVCSCGWGAIPMHLVGLIEGIIYLTKSDEEFVQVYLVNKRPWF